MVYRGWILKNLVTNIVFFFFFVQYYLKGRVVSFFDNGAILKQCSGHSCSFWFEDKHEQASTVNKLRGLKSPVLPSEVIKSSEAANLLLVHITTSLCSFHSEDKSPLTINQENESLGSQIKERANFGPQNLKE